MLNSEPEWTRSDFIFTKQLGVGQFGIVYEAVDRESEKIVAIKIIAKNKITSDILYKRLQREIEIHSRLKHESICKMYGYFADHNHVYLVLEHCCNGNLYLPIKRMNESLSDKKICSIVKQLLSAISYLNIRSIMHRDIKLENILFDHNYNVKLTDFGCCVHSITNRKTVCGTIEYLCPEMINEEVYDHGVDLYCLGIVTYELFYFDSPFFDKEEQEIYKNIKEGVLIFDENIRVIPESAKEFITILLRSGPKPSPKEMLNHEFIKKYGEQTNEAKVNLSENTYRLSEVLEEDQSCLTPTKKERQTEGVNLKEETEEISKDFGKYI